MDCKSGKCGTDPVIYGHEKGQKCQSEMVKKKGKGC